MEAGGHLGPYPLGGREEGGIQVSRVACAVHGLARRQLDPAGAGRVCARGCMCACERARVWVLKKLNF